MTVFIRFCCVSLCLFASCAAEILQFDFDKEVKYDALIAIKSDLKSSSNISTISITQTLQGLLFFQDIEKIEFPISMGFKLEGAQTTIVENNAKSESYSLSNPGNFLELVELRAFKGKTIPFSITNKPPYLSYAQEFLDRYKDIKIFRAPLFAGYFGEDLFNLFTLSERPFKEGDVFEIIEDKTDEKPYVKKKTFIIKEIDHDQVIVEIITLIDRLKLFKSTPEQSVVYYHTKASWTINRRNSLKFKMQEQGTFQLATLQNGEEVLTAHTLEKRIKTDDADVHP